MGGGKAPPPVLLQQIVRALSESHRVRVTLVDIEFHVLVTCQPVEAKLEPVKRLSDSKMAHPHRAVDQLEDSGVQSPRHQDVKDVLTVPWSLAASMQEPALAGEAGPPLVEGHC